jgi:hypothetical protein
VIGLIDFIFFFSFYLFLGIEPRESESSGEPVKDCDDSFLHVIDPPYFPRGLVNDLNAAIPIDPLNCVINLSAIRAIFDPLMAAGDEKLIIHFFFFLFIYSEGDRTPRQFLEGGFFGGLLFVKLRLELIQEFYAPGAILGAIHFVFPFVFL